jgi:hypothetical protein
MHRGNGKYIRNSMKYPGGTIQHGRPRQKWENNINTDFK